MTRPDVGRGPVVATTVCPPSRPTNRAPSSSSTSTRVTSPALAPSPAAASTSSRTEPARRVAAASPSGADARTAPSASSTAAEVICDESSVSSRSAWSAAIAPTLATSGGACREQARELARGGRAVRVLRLPRVPELRDGERLAERNEDRVVSESLAAPPLAGDRPLERPRPTQLGAAGSERDDLADVAGAALLGVPQLGEQPRDALVRPARRVDAGPTSQAVRLDAGVLADHPLRSWRVQTAVMRLDPRVVEEGRTVLDGLVRRLEPLDLPAGQRLAKLAELVLVAGGDEDSQAAGAAAASACAAVSSSIPPAARSRSESRSSRENGSRSAVACTSTSRPSPVITTFMSVSALESSS